MLWIAIVLFLIAALGGLYMAARIFAGAKPPVAVALLHGPIAAAGLFVVFWFWMQAGAPTIISIALGILLLAALGGFFLVSFHMRDKPHPRPVVVIHALAAVTGVVVLLLAALT